MRLTILAAVAVALATVTSAWAQPAEVTLRLRRDVGQALTYRAEISGAGSISLLGEDQPVAVRGRFTRVERTLSQPQPNAWEVQITVEAPSLTFRSGTETQTLAMKVPALTQVMNERGEASEVRGWDATQVAVNAPGMGDAVRPLFGLIQEEGLPERAVKPGDAWTAKAKLKMPDGSETEVEQRCEFVGFKDLAGVPCAMIRSTYDLPIRRQLPANAMGMQVSVDGAQRIDSIGVLAYDQGALLRQDTTIALDLKTSTVLSPQTPEATMPGSIRLRITVVTKLER